MKKSIFSIAIVALVGGMIFTGCKKDSEVVRLKAQIERVGGDSKVWLNDNDAPQFFQSGEYVKINDNDPLEIQYSNGTCTLSPATANNYYAVYPASIVTDEAITGTTVNIKLPHLQNYAVDAGGHQKINLPSGAVITGSGTSLRFYNLCSLIEVQCTIPSGTTGTYTISSIEVTAKDKGLWGEGTATLDGTSSSINIPYNGHNSRVLLEIPNATAISAGQSTGKYYIVVPPYDGTADFTVKVRFNQGSSSFTATKTDAVLERNIIVELNRTQAPTEDTEISGYFSVSANLKVVFSKGNLQAVSTSTSSDPAFSTYSWHFADRQYDFYSGRNVTSDGYHLTSTVDLFGYSIQQTGNYGLSIAESNDDYYYSNNGSFADWGNLSIDNDPARTWFTLTKDEWNYLCNSRVDGNGVKLRARAKIKNVPNHLATPAETRDIEGLILLPDDWSDEDVPQGLDFNYTNQNEYTVDEWARLEAAGVVFLPAAGWRNPSPTSGGNVWNYVENSYTDGHYWTATMINGSGNHESWYMYFQYNVLNFLIQGNNSEDYWYFGKSVRLVKPAPGYTDSRSIVNQPSSTGSK